MAWSGEAGELTSVREVCLIFNAKESSSDSFDSAGLLRAGKRATDELDSSVMTGSVLLHAPYRFDRSIVI